MPFDGLDFQLVVGRLFPKGMFCQNLMKRKIRAPQRYRHISTDRENLLGVINRTCETEVAHARAGENRSRNRPHGPDGARRI